MQITSSGNFTPTHNIQPISSQAELRSNLNDVLTPEQKNTVQQGTDDKIAEQVENVKSNYQTAKDIDLMQSYYQQQQKLFDIYLQTSTDNTSTSSTQNTSAVSALTNTYAELYELHKSVKEGVETLPVTSLNNNDSTNENNISSNVVSVSSNNMSSTLSSKQLDAYNSLMMPSTSSYVHLSA